MDDSAIIDRLGGTAAVAALCEVKAPSVSEWRVKGIPRARRLFLKAVRPDAFEGIASNDAEGGEGATEQAKAA